MLVGPEGLEPPLEFPPLIKSQVPNQLGHDPKLGTGRGNRSPNLTLIRGVLCHLSYPGINFLVRSEGLEPPSVWV